MIKVIKKLNTIGKCKGIIIPKFFIDMSKTDTYLLEYCSEKLIITPLHEEDLIKNKLVK